MPHDRRSMLKRFGLTEADYERMLEDQGERCAICRRPPSSKRRLAVDHDHKTHEVRGLLCGRCNVALGLFNDSIGTIEQALAYLIRGRILMDHDREQAFEQARTTQSVAASLNKLDRDKASPLSAASQTTGGSTGYYQSNSNEAAEPHYAVRLTRSVIRRLAKLSPEADRKLRAQAPAAFIGDIVPLHSARLNPESLFGVDVCFRASDGRPAVRPEYKGVYEGRGLHLDSRYIWSIEPCGDGIGCTLVGRERV